MIRSRLCLLLAGAALLTLPGTASAQTCQAPPGTAGIDQYCESIPGATGDRGTPGREDGAGAPGRRAGSSAGGQAGAPLSPSAREALREAGSAGQGVLALVESERRAGGGAGGRDGRGGPPVAAPETGEASQATPPQGGTPLEAVTRAVDEGGQTLGPAFLWAILGLGLLVGGAGWMRYRRRLDGPGSAPPAGDQ